jgi:energy-coupling factor transporter ATP-binding protein EcfA2
VSLLAITGSYGSGKTELAANLAMLLAETGRPTTLVDLDVVNPYFRSRDMREPFLARGIEVVAPPGQFSHADLPMLPPRVQGAIEDTGRHVILDAGGDPMGARVLARYSGLVQARGYRMVLVANSRRPDTLDAEAIAAMAASIERSSRLGIHEIVANAHLMEETTVEIINEGIRASREAARARGIVFHTACALEDTARRLDLSRAEAPVLLLKKTMLKPWEKGWRASRAHQER